MMRTGYGSGLRGASVSKSMYAEHRVTVPTSGRPLIRFLLLWLLI